MCFSAGSHNLQDSTSDIRGCSSSRVACSGYCRVRLFETQCTGNAQGHSQISEEIAASYWLAAIISKRFQ